MATGLPTWVCTLVGQRLAVPERSVASMNRSEPGVWQIGTVRNRGLQARVVGGGGCLVSNLLNQKRQKLEADKLSARSVRPLPLSEKDKTGETVRHWAHGGSAIRRGPRPNPRQS